MSAIFSATSWLSMLTLLPAAGKSLMLTEDNIVFFLFKAKSYEIAKENISFFRCRDACVSGEN